MDDAKIESNEAVDVVELEPKESQDDEDNKENTVVEWEIEKAQDYILSKVKSFIQDPSYNELLAVKNRSAALVDDVKTLLITYAKTQKMFQGLCKDQNIFLSRVGAESKIKCESKGVGVDFPALTEEETKPKIINPSKPKKETGSVECIDLTSDDESSVKKEKSAVPASPVKKLSPIKPAEHPAPLPSVIQLGQKASDIPPRPILTITNDKSGIVLKWEMSAQVENISISNFEIYCYQEKSNVIPSNTLWQKIGCVLAMPLPMTCTLTKFMKGSKYHFAVRAVTNKNIIGHFSNPVSLFWA